MHRMLRSWRPLTSLIVAVLGAAGCAQERTTSVARDGPDTYVGSAACRDCHLDIYVRWQDTLMANVLQDPRERP